MHFSSTGSSPELPLFSSAKGYVNQYKRVSSGSPVMPQKVGSKGDGGEALQKPERLLVPSSLMQGSTTREELQVAGNDG